MKPIVLVDPFRCRMWHLHDRLEESITEATCRVEIESFSRHGQLIPVLGRAVRGDPDYDIELIYGARRLFAARHINTPLAVELDEGLSDKDAIIAMDIENRQRVDISPYERGLSYIRWLRGGYFESQDEIARALNSSASQISRLLKLARLPSVLVDAFATPADIREGWGLDLAEALGDPGRKAATIQRARAIAGVSPRPAARDVYQQLLAASVPGRKVKPKSREEVVKDECGLPVFRIRHQIGVIALLLPTETVSARSLENIRRAIVSELRGDLQHGVAAADQVEPARQRAVTGEAGRRQAARNAETVARDSGWLRARPDPAGDLTMTTDVGSECTKLTVC
jgi:ParB family chromosome partitioning protein